VSTQHEIILIDGGDDVGQTTDMPGVPTGAPAGPQSNPVQPAPRWKGEPESTSEPREVKGPTAAESAGTLAATVGKMLGGSPLINASQQLVRAFTDINKSIQNIVNRTTASTATVTPNAGPQVQSPTATPTAGPSPEAPQTDPVSGKPVVNVDIQPVPKAGGPAAVPKSPTATPGPAAAPVTGPPAGGATAAQGLASLAKIAGPAAIAVAGLATAVAAGAMVVKGVFDALNNQVKQLEGVSADVSVATSITDMRREMADIRRAEKIGPDIARFENIRSKFEDKAADLWTEVLKVLVKLFETVEPAIELTTDGIGVMTAGFETLNANIDAFRARFTATNEDNKLAQQAQAKASDNMAKAMKALAERNQEEEDPNDPFMAMLMAQFAPGGQI
jgi:hypothetical protein